MFGKSAMLLGLPLFLLSSITIHSDICRLPTEPVITAPTPNAQLLDPTTIVAGTTTQHSTVILKTNGRSLGTTMSDASGDFQVQVTLDHGENHLTAHTTNPCGTSNDTTLDVLVTSTTPEPQPEPTPPGDNPSPQAPPSSFPGAPVQIAPNLITGGAGSQRPAHSGNDAPAPSSGQGLALRITGPDDHSTTTDDSIFLTGITSKKSTQIVEVNSKQTARLDTPNNTFGVLTPLHVGRNVIKVTATAEGQTATAILHVTRTLPQKNPAPWYETYWYVIVTPVSLLVVTLGGIVIKRRYFDA